jgi:hypothetical protein
MLYANGDGHPHRIQAKQQHGGLLEELIDRILGSDRAL